MKVILKLLQMLSIDYTNHRGVIYYSSVLNLHLNPFKFCEFRTLKRIISTLQINCNGHSFKISVTARGVGMFMRLFEKSYKV